MEITVYYIVKTLSCLVKSIFIIMFCDSISENSSNRSISKKIFYGLVMFIASNLFLFKSYYMIIVYYIWLFCYLRVYKSQNKYKSMFWIWQYITDHAAIQGTLIIFSVVFLYSDYKEFYHDVSYRKSFLYISATILLTILLKVHLDYKAEVQEANKKKIKIFTIVFLGMQLAYYSLLKLSIMRDGDAGLYECVLASGLMSISWTQKVKLFYAALLASNSHCSGVM